MKRVCLQCSVSCNSGVQSREVECVYSRRVVDDAFCRAELKPDVRRTCTLISCPEWEVGAWDQVTGCVVFYFLPWFRVGH